jgi:hypothetical protein
MSLCPPSDWRLTFVGNRGNIELDSGWARNFVWLLPSYISIALIMSRSDARVIPREHLADAS